VFSAIATLILSLPADAVPKSTQKLGLFYDIAKTAKSGASVTLGFTLLVHVHSDVLAHAVFPLNVYHKHHATHAELPKAIIYLSCWLRSALYL
jgi:hypothetical protein